MTKTIQIHKQEFDVTTPYAEGHPLTAPEAKALNQVRAENIANNWRKRIKDALEGENADADMKGIRKDFTAYDGEYVFNMASTSSRATMTPLERESKTVARDYLTLMIKKSGTTVKAYKETNGMDHYNAKVAEFAEHEAIVKQAKKNLVDAEKQADAQIDLAI